MPSKLPPVPHKTKLLQQSGYLSTAWSQFFVKLFERVGGFEANTNSEFSVDLTSIETNVSNNSNSISTLQAEMILVQSDLNTVEVQINDILQGPVL